MGRVSVWDLLEVNVWHAKTVAPVCKNISLCSDFPEERLSGHLLAAFHFLSWHLALRPKKQNNREQYDFMLEVCHMSYQINFSYFATLSVIKSYAPLDVFRYVLSEKTWVYLAWKPSIPLEKHLNWKCVHWPVTTAHLKGLINRWVAVKIPLVQVYFCPYTS